MLKIMLNKLKPQAEIIAEEQAGFRAGRSATEVPDDLDKACANAALPIPTPSRPPTKLHAKPRRRPSEVHEDMAKVLLALERFLK